MAAGNPNRSRRLALLAGGGLALLGAGFATGRVVRWVRQPQSRAGLSYEPPAGARRAPPEAGKLYAVPIDGAPALGARHALVTLVMFSDYQCPYCAGLHANLRSLLREAPDACLVWRDFPLPANEKALLAALWARAAGAQGKFWEMADLLLRNQGRIGPGDLPGHARRLALDLSEIEDLLEADGLLQEVQADVTLARSLALPGTPALFANGRFVGGDTDVPALRRVLTEERARAARLVASGVPPGQLYAALSRESSRQ
jgi:protein-disulfide isomerase